MGDYVPSDRLFPEGLGAVSDDIRKAGMKPGIWFEIDNVGRDSHVYSEREDLMLHRDGKVLTTKERRFFDMNNPDAIAYLTDKVIGQLKKYDFEYMKMDYNDTIGIGCDGAESLKRRGPRMPCSLLVAPIIATKVKLGNKNVVFQAE